MKAAVIDWITPKGQSLNPHIPHNVKSGHGFNHEHTGALLCPTGLDWANTEYVVELPSRFSFKKHPAQNKDETHQWPDPSGW